MAAMFAVHNLGRAALRASRHSAKSSAPSCTTRILTRHATFSRGSSRGYASGAGSQGGEPVNAASGGGGSKAIWGILGIGAIGAGSYYAYSQGLIGGESVNNKTFSAKFEDYQKVYDAIAKRLIEQDEYDDGSYGPVLLRLAWHASGTYDKETGTGGSNGATMRFPPEGDHGANSGLKAARDFLEPVKEQFPWISYSDLWILGGVAAIQEMQGPIIPWRPGRQDRDVSFCTPDGRLPDASRDQGHLRAIFNRMGFNDQEIVALSGAHALGRCHTDRSGYDGPWTFSPTVLTNDYFVLMLDEAWQWKKWKGPAQLEDKKTKSLMMLPTDMALVKDKKLRPIVEKYAKDNDAFFQDFSNVIVKLFELGVPFSSSEDSRFRFKPLA